VCLSHEKLRTYVHSIIVSLLNWYVRTVPNYDVLLYGTSTGTVLVKARCQIFSTEESTTHLVHGARFQLHQVVTELLCTRMLRRMTVEARL